ncbi:MAG TPA: phosphatase [Verrucomicrobiales bacterium]|nr:phosphatase [Verrucomicrobiales bacterium]
MKSLHSFCLTLALAGAAGISTHASQLSEAFNGGAPAANPDVLGTAYPNLPAPRTLLQPLVVGTDPLENPSGVITHFGFLSDSAAGLTSGTKTEADENTYLKLDFNPGGPTAGYDYGRHFLFQGHENGGGLAYVTRINLDVTDPAHRITLLTPVAADGKTHYTRIDGSSYNPHTKTLLFTQENGSAGGAFEVSLTWPPVQRDLYGILGQGGYEGVHTDDRGNIYICEDAGGTRVKVDPANPASPKAAANPNSFVYRFVPNDIHDLGKGGKLQSLQVSIGGTPVTFVPVDATHPTGDVFSDNQLALHTVGTSHPVKWVTVHDTSVDGFAPFDANKAAKLAGATPFKRPENGVFAPGSKFRTFVFCPTGDTDMNSGNVPALAARGAWGSIFRVDLTDDRETGSISIVYLGDSIHNSFDNVQFGSKNILLATEDRGDGLHAQLATLDSIWAFDFKKPSTPPVRLVGLGRDAAAAASEDNEPTGIQFTGGDASLEALLGTEESLDDARWFFTQQHGFNTVFEILFLED